MQEQNRENRFSGKTPQEQIQEDRRQIFRSAMLALVALVVLVIACFAWFASNKSVTGILGAVSLGQYGFELASVGNAGDFDTVIPEEYHVDGSEWTYVDSSFETQTGTQTVGKQAILWRMNNDSNLGNNGGDGIRPGSSGILEFYVIPKQSGDLSLEFQLEIIPLNSMKVPYDVEHNISKLLKGHLLFAWQNGDQKELIDISDETFHMTISNAQKDTPVKVSLDWFWPYVFGDAVGDQQYGAQIQEWISNSDYLQFFFYNGGQSVSAQNIRQQNDYYNKADQYIGDNVDWIILKMTGDMK